MFVRLIRVVECSCNIFSLRYSIMLCEHAVIYSTPDEHLGSFLVLGYCDSYCSDHSSAHLLGDICGIIGT